MTIKEAIAKLQKVQDKDQEICMVLWYDEDIIQKAKDMGYVLSKDEVDEVLQYLDKYHDATIGINWDVIDTTIMEVVESR